MLWAGNTSFLDEPSGRRNIASDKAFAFCAELQN